MTYKGKHAHVSVKLPSGSFPTVANGETIEVTASDANALKKLPGWSSSQAPTPPSPEED
jgi:hypothetical protein